MSITCALSAWSIQLLVQPHLPSKCWCNAREPRYLLYNFRPPIQIDDDNTCPLDLYNRLHILEQIESLIRLNQREYVYELGSQPLIVLTTWGRYLSLHKRFNAVLGTKIRSPVLIHYKGEYRQHRFEAAIISCPPLDCPTSKPREQGEVVHVQGAADPHKGQLLSAHPPVEHLEGQPSAGRAPRSQGAALVQRSLEYL